MAFSRIYLEESQGYSPGEKKGQGELIDLQGSPPPRSRMVHPDKQEIKQRQQEACMDEHGAPDKTPTDKGRIQEVEAEPGDPGGI